MSKEIIIGESTYVIDETAGGDIYWCFIKSVYQQMTAEMYPYKDTILNKNVLKEVELKITNPPLRIHKGNAYYSIRYLFSNYNQNYKTTNDFLEALNEMIKSMFEKLNLASEKAPSLKKYISNEIYKVAKYFYERNNLSITPDSTALSNILFTLMVSIEQILSRFFSEEYQGLKEGEINALVDIVVSSIEVLRKQYVTQALDQKLRFDVLNSWVAMFKSLAEYSVYLLKNEDFSSYLSRLGGELLDSKVRFLDAAIQFSQIDFSKIKNLSATWKIDLAYMKTALENEVQACADLIIIGIEAHEGRSKNNVILGEDGVASSLLDKVKDNINKNPYKQEALKIKRNTLSNPKGIEEIIIQYPKIKKSRFIANLYQYLLTEKLRKYMQVDSTLKQQMIDHAVSDFLLKDQEDANDQVQEGYCLFFESQSGIEEDFLLLIKISEHLQQILVNIMEINRKLGESIWLKDHKKYLNALANLVMSSAKKAELILSSIEMDKEISNTSSTLYTEYFKDLLSSIKRAFPETSLAKFGAKVSEIPPLNYDELACVFQSINDHCVGLSNLLDESWDNDSADNFKNLIGKPNVLPLEQYQVEYEYDKKINQKQQEAFIEKINEIELSVADVRENYKAALPTIEKLEVLNEDLKSEVSKCKKTLEEQALENEQYFIEILNLSAEAYREKISRYVDDIAEAVSVKEGEEEISYFKLEKDVNTIKSSSESAHKELVQIYEATKQKIFEHHKNSEVLNAQLEKINILVEQQDDEMVQLKAHYTQFNILLSKVEDKFKKVDNLKASYSSDEVIFKLKSIDLKYLKGSNRKHQYLYVICEKARNNELEQLTEIQIKAILALILMVRRHTMGLGFAQESDVEKYYCGKDAYSKQARLNMLEYVKSDNASYALYQGVARNKADRDCLYGKVKEDLGSLLR